MFSLINIQTKKMLGSLSREQQKNRNMIIIELVYLASTCMFIFTKYRR